MPLLQNNTRRGFSLVELMVATSVATLLMLILAGMSTEVSKLLTVGMSQNQNRNSARIALNFIAQEMEQAAISRNKTYWTGVATVSALQLVINPPDVTLSSLYKNPDAVFWQAPIATNTASGDLAEVGYFVVRQKVKGVFHSDLCRFNVEPTDVSNYKIYSDPSQWITTAIASQFVPNYSNSYKGLFLENVIGLWVVPYKSDGKIMNTTGNPNDEMATDHSYDSRNNNIPSAPIDRLPAMVQVSMVLLDSNSMKKLSANIDTSNCKNAEECIVKMRSNLPPAITSTADTVYFNVTLDNSNP